MIDKQIFLQAIKEKQILGPRVLQTANHIGYGIDDSYAHCMAASVASVCAHNPKEQFVFHVLASGLSDRTTKRIAQLAKELSVEVRLYLIDTAVFKSLPTQVHFPTSIYYRYILPLLLDVPRVLYMDADIVCLDSLQELFNLSMGEKVVAAVPDVDWMNRKRNKVLNLKNHRYFNSGVLLIDIQKWNEQDILAQVMTVLTTEPDKLRYPDQDALNLALTGKTYYLADKWNHLNVIVSDQQDSILLHFAAHPKPWNIAWPLSKICNEFTKDIYKQYEQLTPWKGLPLQMPRNYKEMKVYAKCLWSNGSYLEGLKWYVGYIGRKLMGNS